MFKHYIGGKTIEGKGMPVRVINPATEDISGEFLASDASLAKEALLSAQKAFPVWSGMTLNERSAWICKLKNAILEKKEEILNILMSETGKPLGNADYDFGMLIQCLEYYPEEAKRLTGKIIEDYSNSFRNLIIHQPLGVVVGYLAWNFPLLNVGYKLGPALASGCTCILKPSTKTPLATMKIGEVAEKIGFPSGVFNIIAGSHGEISKVLSKSDIPKMITLIGSSRAGREIVTESSNSIKRYSLELGGNAPAIVMPDADIDRAAYYICDIKYGNAGQICVNVNRVFVHESVHKEFIDNVKKYSEAVKLGWGREDGAMMGPMISKADQERMGALVQDAVSKGAKVICGGTAADKPKGNYFMPTVLDGVTPQMRVYKEEIFGPIMPVLTYKDGDDIIGMANDTEYGLASYLFTKDYKNVFEIGEGLDFGTVCVNEPFFAINLPHGGLKESGVGKDCSSYSLEEYYFIKRISIKMK
jgi:succinate-semialdehyde dehydrogenase / glutarate-semialdehyde dehydrogenase